MAKKRPKARDRPRKRAVDRAMGANRKEKAWIRSLWARAAVDYGTRFADDLLYLSLCGGDARDLELLVQRRVIELTETGAIAPTSAHRVAAVECDLTAVGALLRKFLGLKVYDRPFQSLVRGESQIRYPDGNDAEFCRARIINLDLNAPLQSVEGDEITFPILVWIEKLGDMHRHRPRKDWCLCLTLHGEIHWKSDTCSMVQDFLAENFRSSEMFANTSEALLGEVLYEWICADVRLNFSTLSRDDQQKILMIFVPKKILQMTQSQGWKISTATNCRYGRRGHAPMVSWIIHFQHDRRATTTPRALYVEDLDEILAGAGRVNSRGEVVSEF